MIARVRLDGNIVVKQLQVEQLARELRNRQYEEELRQNMLPRNNDMKEENPEKCLHGGNPSKFLMMIWRSQPSMTIFSNLMTWH